MLLLPFFINQPRGLGVRQRISNPEISGSNPACSYLQVVLKFFVSVFMGSRQDVVPGFESIHCIKFWSSQCQKDKKNVLAGDRAK